ncbi:MAG: hypothetical protein N3D17_02830 [bacterium]|nr:hypothetical protein [bacterium]
MIILKKKDTISHNPLPVLLPDIKKAIKGKGIQRAKIAIEKLSAKWGAK